MTLEIPPLPPISFARVRVEMEAETAIRLPPFSGSALRGAFGAALRKSCCAMDRRSCRGCLLFGVCMYALCFEKADPKGPANPYGLSDPPRPFVLSPPFRPSNDYAPGDRLSCGLTLLGRAADQLPHFLVAFTEMGRRGVGAGRGRFRVAGVADLNREDAALFDGKRFLGAPRVRNLSELAGNGEEAGETRLTVRFETPFRLVADNELTAEIGFDRFVGAVFRRLVLLAPACTGEVWPVDYLPLVREAAARVTAEPRLRWYDWGRRSARQKRSMRLGGVLGEISFSGPVGPFLSLLRAGEIVHAGKACTFGLGRFRISTAEAFR